MAALDKVENSLNDVFGKSAPKLPENGRNVLVQWLPWLSLVGGLLTLLAAYNLWQWANVATGLADYANDLSRALGGTEVVSDRMTAGIWIGLVVLAVQGLLMLAAFPALQKRQKSGWNLLFYGMLLSLVYAVVTLFSDYGGFIGPLVGAIVGFWLLFQVRGKYLRDKANV